MRSQSSSRVRPTSSRTGKALASIVTYSLARPLTVGRRNHVRAYLCGRIFRQVSAATSALSEQTESADVARESRSQQWPWSGRFLLASTKFSRSGRLRRMPERSRAAFGRSFRARALLRRRRLLCIRFVPFSFAALRRRFCCPPQPNESSSHLTRTLTRKQSDGGSFKLHPLSAESTKSLRLIALTSLV